MRLEGTAKMGYYPTPGQTLKNIAKRLYPRRKGHRINVGDFQAGTGEAIVAVDRILTERGADMRTFGVELSANRADILRKQVDFAIRGDYLSVTASNQFFGLLWINPPYDWVRHEAGEPSMRQEYEALKNMIQYFMREGILVYIVPRHVASSYHVARYLLTHFKDVEAYNLPNDEGENFNQVIVFGKHRGSKIEQATQDQVNELMDMVAETEEYGPLPVLTGEEPALLVPTISREAKTIFRLRQLIVDDTILSVHRHGVHETREWKDYFADKTKLKTITPVQEPRRGHLAMIMAGNLLGAQKVGPGVVARGSSTKNMVAIKTDKEGKKIKREMFSTEIYVLEEKDDPDRGEGKKKLAHRTITDVTDLENFLKEYGEHMAETIRKRYKPLYSIPDPAEWDKLNPLFRNKQLPGRAEVGLLPQQKHTILAASASVKKNKYVIVSGEMGTGKTSMGTSIAFLNDWFPVIILCPPTLTENWRDEIYSVLGKDKVKVAIIDSGTMTGKRLTVIDNLVKSHKPGDRLFVIISKETAKLGGGWEHAHVPKTIYQMDRSGKRTQRDEEGNKIKETWATCPNCGRLLDNGRDVVYTAEEFEKLGAQKKCSYCKGAAFQYGSKPNNPKLAKEVFSRWEGVDLDGKPFEATKNSGGVEIKAKGQPRYLPHGAQHTDSVLRWPVIDYIKRKYPNFFKLLIADEVHQYKGKDSDQAMAFHHAVSFCDYTVAMTGTLFGGKSTSIFWLLHRLDAGVRRDYKFNDEARWSEYYGRLESIISTSVSKNGKSAGTKRETERIREIPGIAPTIIERLLHATVFLKLHDLDYELPDYVEEIIRISLDGDPKSSDYDEEGIISGISKMKTKEGEGEEERISISFEDDDDLENLEEGVTVEDSEDFGKTKPVAPVAKPLTGPLVAMGEAAPVVGGVQWAQYTIMNNFLEKQVKDFKASNRMSWVGAWLVNGLGRPNSGFRKETVYHLVGKGEAAKHEAVMELEALVDEAKHDQLLPKEAWLINTIKAEKAQDRKTIVYVNQTGTRDIQPRLEKILKRNNIRAEILPASLSPRRRKGWINENAGRLDVLIVNPKKVETGLDLVQFSTIIFYEIQYSLYIMWQAMRRVWRLGQTKPVKILYPVYRNTMEEIALDLMGMKMKAAMQLYGDNVSSAFTENADTGDFLAELAHRILSGANIGQDKLSTSVMTDGTQNKGKVTVWDKAQQDLVEKQHAEATAYMEPDDGKVLVFKDGEITEKVTGNPLFVGDTFEFNGRNYQIKKIRALYEGDGHEVTASDLSTNGYLSRSFSNFEKETGLTASDGQPVITVSEPEEQPVQVSLIDASSIPSHGDVHISGCAEDAEHQMEGDVMKELFAGWIGKYFSEHFPDDEDKRQQGIVIGNIVEDLDSKATKTRYGPLIDLQRHMTWKTAPYTQRALLNVVLDYSEQLTRAANEAAFEARKGRFGDDTVIIEGQYSMF